jgi:hypothetical protein
MTLSIVAFLKARVTEDRDAAINGELGDVRYGGTDLRSNIRNQDRMLREAHAKEVILEDHQIKPATAPEPDDDAAFGCERCHFDRDEGVYGFGYCPTLKALAGIYSDHPDYDESWKP